MLDALTRREWVKEDLLAGELGLHPKQVRKCLRFLAQDQLVVREFRRERGGKIEAPEGAEQDGGGISNPKGFTHSYSCIDYARCVDVARYRVRKMLDRIRDELDDKGSIQEYACGDCGREYTSFDAVTLMVDPDDFAFRCASCPRGKLVDKRGDDAARRAQKAELRVFRELLVKQLRPLTSLLQSLEGSQPPDYGTLNEWYMKALAAAKAQKADPGARQAPGLASDGLKVELGGGSGGPSTVPGFATGTGTGAGGEVSEAAPPPQKKELPAWLRSGGVAGNGGRAPSVAAAAAAPQPNSGQASKLSVHEAYINEFLKRQRADSVGSPPPEKKIKLEPEGDAVGVEEVAWEDADPTGDADGVEWEDA